MIKKHKILIIVLSSILIFVILISSCIADTYSYYFDAMKVKRMFYQNKEAFEGVVEYLLSKNIEKGQTIEIDSTNVDFVTSDMFISIGNSHIRCSYYDIPNYITNEYDIKFYYLDFSYGIYLNYSSNDFKHSVGGSYEWKVKKLDTNWYLCYETPFENRKG